MEKRKNYLRKHSRKREKSEEVMDKMENDLKREAMIREYLRGVFGLINRGPFDKINMIMRHI